MGRISVGWKSYEVRVVPPDAPDVQRKETKRAFYAGVISMLSVLVEAGNKEDADMLKDIYDEALDFNQDVLDGKE